MEWEYSKKLRLQEIYFIYYDFFSSGIMLSKYISNYFSLLMTVDVYPPMLESCLDAE